MPKHKIILNAVKRLVAKRGVRGITAGEIASEAKVAKGTLYLYFKSKEDIFLHLLEGLLEDGEALVKKAGSVKGPAVKKIEALIRYDLAFYEKNFGMFKKLGMEMDWVSNVLDMEARKKLMKRHFDIVRSVAKFMEEAVEEKSIAKIEPLEASVVLISMIHAYAGMRIHGLSNKPLTKQAVKILKLFLHGVGK